MEKPSKGRAEKRADQKKAATFAIEQRARLKQAFLDNYPDYGTMWHTAKAVGTTLPTVDRWLNDDAAFAEAFKTIRKVPGYMVERSSLQRCYDKSVPADTLRIFILKNLLSDQYGEADKLQIEMTVSNILVSNFISIVQQNVPDTCPHCKTNLGLSAKVASELKALSEAMLKAGALGAQDARTQEV